MLQDECEMEELAEEDADTMDMNIVKQMIGLKINVGDSEQDRNSSSDDSDTPAARANILCASNKVYDFKQKSSKVSSYASFCCRLKIFQIERATFQF